MRVFVYRNLRTGTWSAKAMEGPQSGRVIDRPDTATIADAELRVSKNGPDRVRSSCQKEVHAGVVGRMVRGIPADYPRELIVEVNYNPYLYRNFVALANNVPVRRAAYVHLPHQPKGGHAPLLAALYPEDAHIARDAKLPVDPALLARLRECKQPRSNPFALAAGGRSLAGIASNVFATKREALAAARYLEASEGGRYRVVNLAKRGR